MNTLKILDEVQWTADPVPYDWQQEDTADECDPLGIPRSVYLVVGHKR